MIHNPNSANDVGGALKQKRRYSSRGCTGLTAHLSCHKDNICMPFNIRKASMNTNQNPGV